ncbi:hypothetical protein ACXR0O_29395 [Verrucomicrobiota bacterium sgz303538]
MKHHLIQIAFAVIFSCTAISADMPAKSSGESTTVAKASITGEWQSVAFGGESIEKLLKTMRYDFRPGGKFSAFVEFTNGDQKKLEGSYVVRETTLEMTVPGDGADPFPYSLVDGVLTIRDPKIDSFVKLRRSTTSRP